MVNHPHRSKKPAQAATTEHTPTPWYGNGPDQLDAPNGENIATFHKSSDRDFAKRAVNAHDALVKALEDVSSYYNDGSTVGEYEAVVLEQVRVALALANGDAT